MLQVYFLFVLTLTLRSWQKNEKIEKKKWYVPFHPVCTVLETKKKRKSKNITFRCENGEFAEFCCACAYCSSRRPCDWPYSTTTQTGTLGRRLSNHKVFKNKRFSSCFAKGPIKLKIQTCNRWKLYHRLNLPELLENTPQIYEWNWSVCKKKLIIFCYQEVVIGQSFCPGSSTHTVIGVRTSWNLATQKKQDSGHCC